MNTTARKTRRCVRRLGLTPGGELWNIQRETIARLEKFPQQTRLSIIRAAIVYFVTAKPGDALPGIGSPDADAMLRELITGEPVEMGVR